MNILILNYCLKYFDHFCLISLYTVQYMSPPEKLASHIFLTCPRLFSDNCPGKTRSPTWKKSPNLDSISMRSRRRTLKYPASSRFQFVSSTWKKDVGNILKNVRFHVNLRKVLISGSFLEVSPELLKMKS